MWHQIKMDVVASKEEFTYLNLLLLTLTSAGFQLILSYRIQCMISRVWGGSFLARIINYITTVLTGCHIDRRAVIGGGMRFPHATGIVISRRAVIHDWVTIYQNVTLGTKRSAAPTIKDHVSIYSGACIIGGVIIGSNTQVGANAVVIESIPDNHIALSPLARIIPSFAN